METLLEKYRHCFAERRYRIAFGGGWLLLALSLVVNYFAAFYADTRASGFVADIVLSNIRVFDVELFFVYGPILFWIIVGLVLLSRPHTIPFTLKSIGLFVVIRSVFISLTHLGPVPTQLVMNVDFMNLFTKGSDFFFSGHTGLPVLMALIFWKDFRLRVFFYVAALFFGLIVLLGHLHYSIDVLSAFFITYAIYHLSLQIFKKDYQMFLSTRQHGSLKER